MVSNETKKLFLKLVSEIGIELAEHLLEEAKQKNGQVMAAIVSSSEQEAKKTLESLIGSESFSIEKMTENPAGTGRVAFVKMQESGLRVIRSKSLALFFIPVITGVHLETNSHQGKYDLKLISTKEKRIIKSLLRVIPSAKAKELLQLSRELSVLLDCPLIEKQKENQK